MKRMVDIVDSAPANVGGFLTSYYYIRFETINLKRILRGKISEFTPERITSTLIPMPPYGIKSYDDLSKAKNVEEVLTLLKSSKYSKISEMHEKYLQEQSIQFLEQELDQISSKNINEALKQIPVGERRVIQKMMKIEADVENFLQAVKIGRNKSESKTFNVKAVFPVVYTISYTILEKVALGADVEDTIQTLPMPYVEMLKPLVTGDVALVRSRLRNQIYKTANLSRAENDFGFNPILAYLVYSEIEKNDLVSIAWAKEQNVPTGQLLKYLVVPNYI
jgi:vacuolar-type H+-ATPase subunit C/Vma6